MPSSLMALPTQLSLVCSLHLALSASISSTFGIKPFSTAGRQLTSSTPPTLAEANICYDQSAYLPEHQVMVHCVLPGAKSDWEQTCCSMGGTIKETYCEIFHEVGNGDAAAFCESHGGTVDTASSSQLTCFAVFAHMDSVASGTASCDVCKQRLSTTDDTTKAQRQNYLVMNGCCGPVDAFTACHRVCGLSVDTTFGPCETSSDFLPKQTIRAKCSVQVNPTDECQRDDTRCGSAPEHISTCDTWALQATPSSGTGGATLVDPQAQCTSQAGVYSSDWTCESFAAHYFWGTVPQGSQPTCETSTQTVALDQVSSFLPTVGHRARFISRMCCQSQRTNCPLSSRPHSLVTYHDTTCSKEYTSQSFANSSFVWDQCFRTSPDNMKDLFNFQAADVHFIASCNDDGGVVIKTGIASCPLVGTPETEMQLDLAQVQVLVAGGCAVDTTGSYSLKAFGITFPGACGEIEVPIGTARPFPGFGIAEGYGCEGEIFFMNIDDALNACRGRSDCLGIANPGCRMAESGGVYSLCKERTMRCCESDCTYMKV